uniref:ABC-2 type transporter n=1 Tax=Rhodymenia pseudopalmata TaxID=31502 RepID=A0A1C9C7U3_RHOPU|nr:ABC-2 type transporter [Rhodymenia pseudopalmata]AOM64449.1 ABC-2 type transporter [Rhodymenia pseudopalmata]
MNVTVSTSKKSRQKMQFKKIKPRRRIDSSKHLQHSMNAIYALTKRLYIQLYRRPASLVSGIIQPLLWLILFGALFQNAPVDLLTSNIKYGDFLSPGIIVFTAFTGSINAGLPLMFDREFGFLNRLMVAPMKSRDSLFNSLIFFITSTTVIQTSFIIICSFIIFHHNINFTNLILIHTIILITTLSIASVSICLAFILPGHIELLAFILVVNLPTLFSSTALAPLSFMPYWLQIIAKINPLTYAIESTRRIYFAEQIITIQNAWSNLNYYNSIYILIFVNIISFISVKLIISRKFE